MKESSTYQYMLEEGRAEGRVEGRLEGRTEGRVEGQLEEARRMLLLIGGKRFGEADADAREALDKITSQQTLEQLATRLFEVEDWHGLLR